MWSSLLFICIVMQSQLSWQLVMILKKIYIPKKEKKMNQKQHWCKITLGKDAALWGAHTRVSVCVCVWETMMMMAMMTLMMIG